MHVVIISIPKSTESSNVLFIENCFTVDNSMQIQMSKYATKILHKMLINCYYEFSVENGDAPKKQNKKKNKASMKKDWKQIRV